MNSLKNSVSIFSVLTVTLTAGVLVQSADVNAAGFAVREQSTEGQGASFAGIAAGGSDLSSMFFNPATITLHPGRNIEVNGALILSNSKLGNGAAVHPVLGPLGGGNGGNIGVPAVVPATYLSFQASQKLFFGLGLNTPFGLTTKANDGWIGRFHGVKSKVLTLNANPVVGYKFSPMISAAVGAQVQYINVKLTNSAFTFAGESGARLKADDVGYGFTAGVLIEPSEYTRIGIGFRSKVKHTVNGGADFAPGLVPVRGAGPIVFDSLRSTVTLPETVTVGLRQMVTPKFTVLAGFEWANWSRFKELRIQFNGVLPDNVTVEEWKDSYFYSLGGEYKYDDMTTVRAGVAFEDSGVPDSTRTPRVPDNDRYWLSAGFTRQVNSWISVTGAYTHVFVKNAPINLTLADPNNATRGTLSGTFKTDIDIFSISVNAAL